MKKDKKPNIFVRWNRLVNPHKGYWAGQIITYTIYAVLLTVMSIFAARVIDAMYAKKWDLAFLNLALELGTIIVRNISLHLEYYYYGKQHIAIRGNVAKKIYNKLLSCENSGLKNLSKEKISNIALNNMSELSEFPDAVAKALSYSIQVAITLVTVFIANYLAGIIVTVLGIVNWFVIYYLNKTMGKVMLDRYEKKDEMYKAYETILDGKEVINELKAKDQYEGDLISKVEAFSKSYKKYYMLSSWKNNVFYAIWNVVVYAITALLLYYVSKGTLAMSIYLIIVPYLSTCTEKLINLFDKTSAIENMRVDVDRVNLILELNDKQLIKYGELDSTTEGYNLGLMGVTYRRAPFEQGGSLYDADVSFKMGGINVIKGAKESGKRVIFDVLRRRIEPQEGKVLLDNLDLFNYNEKTFKKHIDYCASHPSFVRGTIEQNLMLVGKNSNKVKEACDKVGLTKHLQELPNGIKTQIRDINSSGVLFLVGLARAILSECKILMIYEMPQNTNPEFRENIKNLITDFKLNKTIILFTHTDLYDDIADICYEVKVGKISIAKKVKSVDKK